MTLSASASKAQLRESMQQQRVNLSAEFRRQAGRQALHQLQGLSSVQALRHIGLYWAIAGELPTRDLFDWLKSQGKQAYFPRIMPQAGNLEFVAVEDLEQLMPTHFGLMEPRGDLPAAAWGDVELLLIPGLAFDRAGYRLGWGKAYYDQALPSFSGLRIGMAYDFQLLPSIPHEAHDVPMHGIVTECRSLRFEI